MAVKFFFDHPFTFSQKGLQTIALAPDRLTTNPFYPSATYFRNNPSAR